MIAIDSNIVIYALNNNADFAIYAQSILLRMQKVGGIMSTILRTESLCITKDPIVRNEIHSFLSDIKNTIFISVDPKIADYAGQILADYPAIKIADAIHLATAKQAGATEFWTNDNKLCKVSIKDLIIRPLSEASL